MSDKPETSILDSTYEPPDKDVVQFDMEVNVDESDLFDHTEEQKLKQQHEAQTGSAAPPRPKHVDIPPNNPVMMVDPVGDIREGIDKAFIHMVDHGRVKYEVKVDEEERERFVRAALHDAPMWFDAQIDGVGATVRVVIPPDSFSTAVARALDFWDKDTLDTKSNMQWYLAFQQVHAWFQIREINGLPTPWAEEHFPEGEPHMSLSAIRKFIRYPANFDMFFTMSPVRWRMITEAMRIAELKYKMCMDAGHDRDFFTSADTD